MLLESGKVKSLTGRPWAGIELVSESRIEEIVLHLANWARGHLKEEPFQLLFPVKTRDLKGIKLLSPYLWARTTDLSILTGVRTVMGVAGLVSDGASKTIEIEDTFVQEMIKESRAAAEGWSKGIKKGSFARVLFGEERMLCGAVTQIVQGVAELKIKLRLRDVLLYVPVRALLNLSHVEKSSRHYFYTGEEDE